MRVAAYQSDLAADPGEVLGRLRRQVRRCEDEGVQVLCCPEAVMGGLADDADGPIDFALPAADLESALAPLASDRVTSIVGFTELAAGGVLFNSAAVLHNGTVLGIYRKLHPAINRSVYRPGQELRTFQIPGLTFGIVICNDSNFPRPAERLRALGAAVLFIPTNNALPADRFDPGRIAEQARAADVALATAHGLWVVRADVSGMVGSRLSTGSSGVVDPGGAVVRSGAGRGEHLLTADLALPDR